MVWGIMLRIVCIRKSVAPCGVGGWGPSLLRFQILLRSFLSFCVGRMDLCPFV